MIMLLPDQFYYFIPAIPRIDQESDTASSHMHLVHDTSALMLIMISSQMPPRADNLREVAEKDLNHQRQQLEVGRANLQSLVDGSKDWLLTFTMY